MVNDKKHRRCPEQFINWQQRNESLKSIIHTNLFNPLFSKGCRCIYPKIFEKTSHGICRQIPCKTLKCVILMAGWKMNENLILVKIIWLWFHIFSHHNVQLQHTLFKIFLEFFRMLIMDRLLGSIGISEKKWEKNGRSKRRL